MLNENKLIDILEELIKDVSDIAHNPEICSRSDECDSAAEDGSECSYCGPDGCFECECGVDTTHKIIDRALKIIEECKEEQTT
jgi:hypothetical protein